MTPALRPTPIRILVVDDERPIAVTLAAIFSQRGYRALSAFDGDEAIFTAQQFRPDCLVCDVVMPGLDGVDVAIAIRQLLPECKVLLVSGQVSAWDLVEQARERGFDFELAIKPIHPDDLLHRVDALLGPRTAVAGGSV